MQLKANQYSLLILFTGVFALLLLAGCSKQQATRPPQEVAVKAMQVVQKDTPITYEFVGEVEAKDEAQIKANISGTIMEKMVKGGDVVAKGQPLFRIDSRQYTASVLNAKAQLAESAAALSQVHRDVVRYQTLAASQAIAQQVLDTTIGQEQQASAKVDADQAQLRLAEINSNDTLVVAPMDGRINVQDLSIGNYVTAGQTTLATISSVNPVRIRFSMSETEYLRFARLGSTGTQWGQELKLILSDGTEYPLTGKVEQVDRGLAQQTGTLTIKAAFENPDKLLVPGMFTHIVATGEMRLGALLVPQRAIQSMLGKTFITVVTDEDKAESRAVKLGARIGNMQIVEEGLSAGDRVVVEGSAKAQPGTPLKVTMIVPDDLKIPVTK